MNWNDFSTFLVLILIGWTTGIALLYAKKSTKTLSILSMFLIIVGIIALDVFTVSYWIDLERPPFKSLTETFLWSAVFLSIIGVVLFIRWKSKLLLFLILIAAAIFLTAIYFMPASYDKTLMPALQSSWFIPHVIIYMLAYSFMTILFVISIVGLLRLRMEKSHASLLMLSDRLVYIGFSLLTFGMMLGAIWAKEAWGHYWTWDPKETWALITWLVYLIFIHYRFKHKKATQTPLWILSIAFIFLLICWFGINYLPAAQESIHVY